MIRQRFCRGNTFSGLILLAVVSASGCGASSATVEGMVTIDGTPANNGTVIFSSADHRSAGGAIGADGYFIAENVPVGEVKVAIHQMMMMGGGPDRPGPLKGIEEPVATVARPIPIPKRYQSIETSNFNFTITGANQHLNLELTSK